MKTYLVYDTVAVAGICFVEALDLSRAKRLVLAAYPGKTYKLIDMKTFHGSFYLLNQAEKSPTLKESRNLMRKAELLIERHLGNRVQEALNAKRWTLGYGDKEDLDQLVNSDFTLINSLHK